ncbi:hypothetical protein SHO565_43140 [Streptomyces sp. HO565]
MHGPQNRPQGEEDPPSEREAEPPHRWVRRAQLAISVAFRVLEAATAAVTLWQACKR